MSYGLATRSASGRTFHLQNGSDGATVSEAHVRLLIAKVCDETGVPNRMVDVWFDDANAFTVFAPDAFLDCLAEEQGVEG